MTSPLRREPNRAAIKAGWSASLTRRSHIRLVHPATSAIVICSGSPSDWRVIRNVKADMRRALRKIERNPTS
jgi:hypothetical protein